jgi:elongator complex protein 3
VKLYKKGKFKPYSKEQVQDLVIKIMKLIPNYCRVMRIMREIPPEHLVDGIIRIDLRKDIDAELKLKNVKVNEIRFREIGFALRDLERGEKINNKLELKINKYKASGGDEYFLEIVNKDNILFGLCRLRICEGQAFVRELHIYGKALMIGEKAGRFGQHKGLGRKLIAQAEKIAFKVGVDELKIISGVGVRKYYKKLGYKLDEGYMVKKL